MPCWAGARRTGASARGRSVQAPARGAALCVAAAASKSGGQKEPAAEAGEARPSNGAPASQSKSRALAAKDRTAVTRRTLTGGPGTATERVQRGLPAEYSKNIIPQGSFWRDGREPGSRTPFKEKWSWLSDPLRRACGDSTVTARTSGNWLKAPPAPPPPTDRIGLRKTPTSKQRRGMKPQDMGWYGYLALKPILPKVKGAPEEDLWSVIARDGRQGAGREAAKPGRNKVQEKKSGKKADDGPADPSGGLADQKRYDW